MLPYLQKSSHPVNHVRIALVSQKGILLFVGLGFPAEGWFTCIQFVYTHTVMSRIYILTVFVRTVFIPGEQMSVVFFSNILLPR